MHDYSTPVIVDNQAAPQAAVIFLHGLGADGYDLLPAMSQLKLAKQTRLRFIFPHAAERTVALYQNQTLRAWFGISGAIPGNQKDSDSLAEAEQQLHKLITAQIEQGIPAEKIILAGFSQGGALALHTGLRYTKKLAGIIGLSTYLPTMTQLIDTQQSANRATAIFLAHGDQDQVLSLASAQLLKQSLEKLGYPIEWHLYNDMQHSICEQELDDLSAFLNRVV